MPIEEDENFEEENLEEDENLEEENLEEENLEEDEGEEDEEAEGNEEEEEGEFDPTQIKNLFAPNEYPKELQPAFKKMQGIFTTKMQGLSERSTLIELMENNPEELISMLAKKTGLTVSKAGEKKEEGEVSDTEKWIVDLIKKHAGEGDKGTKLAVAKMQSKARIDLLTKDFPDWTMYEDEMTSIVKKNPTLADDLESVYVLAKKNVDKASTVIAGSKKKAKVSTKTMTQKKVKTSPRPKTARAALEAAFTKLYG